MPMNPDSRYVLEAKLLEASYKDCIGHKDRCVKTMKEALMAYIPSTILAIITSFIDIRGRTYLAMAIIILLSIGFFWTLESAKNLAISPEVNENIKDILYGDKYAISEANPEELYNHSKDLRENSGKLIMFNRMFSIYFIIHTCINMSLSIGNMALFMLKM